MGSTPRIWDARNATHLRWWRREVLTPLIGATRAPELRTPEAVEDACRAWVLSLPEIREPVLVAGVQRLLQTLGPNEWMPKPGDLRGACAAVVADLRRELAPRATAIVADCVQCGGSTWEPVQDVTGREVGVRRCSCHQRALAVYAGVPEPIALPPATDAGDAA